jgi:KRAB domain-containing zinc finger protein
MTCHYCEKKFKARTALIVHVQVHQKKSRPRKCKLCQLEFPDFNAVVDHQVSVHNRKCFTCTKCNKKFTLPCHLRMHVRTHLSNYKRYICDICGNKFRRRNDIASHMEKIHLDKATCRVKGCNVKCKNEKTLRAHMENFHNQTRHGEKCDICGRAVKNMAKHKLIGHKQKILLACQFCQKQFQRKWTLAHHLLEVHGHVAGHVKDHVRTCHLCEKKILGPKNMLLHMERHKKRERLSKCKICQLEFPDQNTLIDHQVAAHKRKCYTCVKCSKKFITSGGFRKHQSSHLTDVAHICDICGKQFSRREYVKLHMKSHMHKIFVRCK